MPISRVDPFIRETVEKIAAIDSDLRVNSYGHIGDGNIHHNVLPPEGRSKSDFVKENPDIVDSVRTAINKATLKFGGSISAEHGIGRLKARDLKTFANEGKLNALKRIKHALDPNNVMNPGALVRRE